MQKLTQRLTIAVFALVLLGFMVLHLLLPDGTISRAERRKLQQFPAVSSEALLSAEFSEDVEDYLLDQFPFRDSFRTLKAVWTYDLLGQKDNNGIYIAEGTASKLDATLDEKQLKLFTDKMNSLHETYFPNANVYCAVIPDKNYYLAPSHGYPTLDYEKLFSTVEEALPWATHVDLTGSLTAKQRREALGRQKMDTFAVTSAYHQRVWEFIQRQVAEGRQAYVICAMVEESDTLPDERKAVTEYAKKLQAEVFPDLKVAFVHGKMKPREKDAVMTAFAAHETDILVSTTVIEVGVDVPNAAVMVIENAERFGLSQLHQLRGRVGRGKHKSYCVLMTATRSQDSRARLKALASTTDGFKIAEEDLKLRGPGDFFGSRQHGLPQLHIADLAGDVRVLKEAQQAAHDLLEADPGLTRPKHRPLLERVKQMFSDNPDIFN